MARTQGSLPGMPEGSLWSFRGRSAEKARYKPDAGRLPGRCLRMVFVFPSYFLRVLFVFSSYFSLVPPWGPPGHNVGSAEPSPYVANAGSPAMQTRFRFVFYICQPESAGIECRT